MSTVVPVQAKPILGVVPSPQGPQKNSPPPEYDVAIRFFADGQELLDWLLRYRELDAALIPQAAFAAQPAGALMSVGTVKLASAPSPQEWVVAVRGDLPAGERDALVTSVQGLLQSEAGLLLIERLVDPSAADRPVPSIPPVQPSQAAATPSPRPVATAAAAAVGESFSAPDLVPATAPPIAESVSQASVSTASSPPETATPRPADETAAPAPRPETKPVETAPAPSPPRVARTNQQRWIFPRLEIQGKLGNDRSLADADLFLPLFQDRISLLFLDLRFQLDDDQGTEGNFGFGLRRLFDDWIAGGYAFYDVRESENNNTFRQVTLGAEALTERYDGRFNLYLADEEKKLFAEIPGEDAFVYESNHLVYSRSSGLLLHEQSLSGLDFEWGGRLPGPAYPEVRGYLGGYYFDAAGIDEIAGPRARVSLRFPDLFGFAGACFELGAELTHDSERDTDYYLTAGLRIPLGDFFSTTPAKLTPLETRMAERVRRDPDVMVVERRAEIPAIIPQALSADGRELTFVHVDGGVAGAGSGTAEAPYGALPAAADADIILLYADSVLDGAGIVLAEGQRLLGEADGVDHLVSTDQFPSLLLPRASTGIAPPIIVNAPEDAVTLTGSAEVSSLVIRDAGGDGVAVGSGVSGDFLLDRLTIDGAAGDGVSLLVDNGVSSFVLRNSLIQRAAGNGLTVEASGGATISTAEVTATTIRDIEGRGADVWIHGDATLASLRIGNPEAKLAGDVTILNTNTAGTYEEGGLFILAGVLGESGTISKAALNGVTVQDTGGFFNVWVEALGESIINLSVSNSALDATGSAEGALFLIANDSAQVGGTVTDNLLENGPLRGFTAENYSSGEMSLYLARNAVGATPTYGFDLYNGPGIMTLYSDPGLSYPDAEDLLGQQGNTGGASGLLTSAGTITTSPLPLP